MTSSIQKGNQLEIIAKSILEQEGYVVHRAIRSFVTPKGGKTFVRSNDIFGCFDLIAVSSHMKPRFIQITYLSKLYERRKKVDKVMPFVIHASVTEVWAWHKGRGKMFFAQFIRDKDMEWVRGKDIYQRNGR